jgi:trimeric autotransporter adhesin
MPLHAMKFDGVGIAVNPEIANFQIWSQVELPTAPAGSSLLKYGFVALPNQYYLTFAFKLPLQTPRSDDPFSFTMQFASYSDTENRVTESLEEQGASSGAAGRALAQNNASINTMPSSTIVSSPTVRKICSVKTALAGTYNSVSYLDVELYAPISTGCTP